MDKKERDIIKDAFLKNIGTVIRRHREAKRISQDTLGAELGVSHSAIQRYETGGADITASSMAIASTFLEFPLKEYVQDVESKQLPGDKAVPFDDVILRLTEMVRKEKMEKEIKKAEKEDAQAHQVTFGLMNEFMTPHYAPSKPQRPPKPDVVFNNQTGKWEMVEKPSLNRQRKVVTDFTFQIDDRDMEEAGLLLETVSEELPLEKRLSVQRMYQVIAEQMLEAEGRDIKDLTSMAKATLNYALSDVTPKDRKKIQWYLNNRADVKLEYKLP